MENSVSSSEHWVVLFVLSIAFGSTTACLPVFSHELVVYSTSSKVELLPEISQTSSGDPSASEKQADFCMW